MSHVLWKKAPSIDFMYETLPEMPEFHTSMEDERKENEEEYSEGRIKKGEEKEREDKMKKDTE